MSLKGMRDVRVLLDKNRYFFGQCNKWPAAVVKVASVTASVAVGLQKVLSSSALP